MLQTLLLVHAGLVLLLIIVILLQRSGESALGGLSGGSASGGSLFSARGGKNFMTRLTAILATLFIVSSLGLAMVSKRDPVSTGDELIDDIIQQEQGQPGSLPPATDKPAGVPDVPLSQ